MKTRQWLSNPLDYVGMVALMGATVTLLSALCFSERAGAAVFSTFFTCFVVAITAFLSARIVQLVAVVIKNPDGRAHRMRQEKGAIRASPIGCFSNSQ